MINTKQIVLSADQDVKMSNAPCCSICYKEFIGNCFVKCKICYAKFHNFCAGIDNDAEYKLLKKSINIVFNCNNCVKSSNDLIAVMSTLTSEIAELKIQLLMFSKNNNTENILQLRSSLPNAVSKSTQFENYQPVRQPLHITSHKTSHLITSPSHSAVNVVVPDCNDDNIRNANMCAVTNDTNDDAVVGGRSAVDGSNVNLNTNINSVNSSQRVIDTHSHSSLPISSSYAATVTSQAEGDIPANNLPWSQVTRKRKGRRVVFGVNTNSELDVIVNKKWVHLSSFKPSVTTDQILNYVEKYANVTKNHLVCYKLVKKDADVNALTRISFKLGVSAGYYNELFKPSLWPSDVRVRPFKFFPKTGAEKKQI